METTFERYFKAVPSYVTVQDRDFRVVEANDRFRRDFGDLEGRRCYQIYKGRSEKCLRCPVERTFHDGQGHRSEEAIRLRDGSELSVIVETAPVRGEDGEIVSVLEMCTDIHLIKKLERQLKESWARHRLLFEEVPCYISIQDPDLHVVEANRAFLDDFGDALGRRCWEAYKHRGEECVPCPVRSTFEDGQPHSREEVVTTIRGRTRNVLVTTAPIRDESGNIVSVMEMSADITEVRRLESKLTQLGLLIGTVSHSLKGLLNGLAGGMYLVDTGLRKDDSARVRRGWETVHRNVDRIKSMVSDILYYAKERTPVHEPVDAAALAGEVAGLMEARARELGVELAAEADPEAGEFQADLSAVRSLLVNLVENSLDACRMNGKREDHRVSLRVRGHADHVLFEVEDTGIGMDRETREKAFSLFFSSKGTGTGLGLFIADRIAGAHGGSIGIASEPGAGTLFTVRLPRTKPEEEPGARAPGERRTTHGRRREDHSRH